MLYSLDKKDACDIHEYFIHFVVTKTIKKETLAKKEKRASLVINYLPLYSIDRPFIHEKKSLR